MAEHGADFGSQPSTEDRVHRLERDYARVASGVAMLSGLTALRMSRVEDEQDAALDAIEENRRTVGAVAAAVVILGTAMLILSGRIGALEDALDAIRRAPRMN